MTRSGASTTTGYLSKVQQRCLIGVALAAVFLATIASRNPLVALSFVALCATAAVMVVRGKW
jgi:hypothetical protein